MIERGRRLTHFLRVSPRSAARTSPSTLTWIDMDLRKSFSKPFKKLKHRLMEGNRRPDGRPGREDNREGREADVEGSEVSQMNSRLHSEVEDVVESRPGWEETSNDVKGKNVERVDSSSSPPSISQGGESGSTQTTHYFNFYL